MSATDARERAIADSQFGGGSTTWAPGTWYLGLSTTVPNEDGSGFSEPSGGSYGRVSIANNATSFPPAAMENGVTVKKNGIKFTFPDPTASWGTIAYYGFFTTSSGGVPQYFGALDTTISPKNGNTPVEFDIGQLVMAWD